MIKFKKSQDTYGILNSMGKRRITLEKMCNIMGIDVPKEFYAIKDVVQNNVVSREKYIVKGCYFIVISEITNLIRVLDRLKQKGVKLFFVDKELYDKFRIEEKNYPVIPVPDIIDRGGRFYSYIKDLGGAPVTIGVTGTLGKTTTMNILREIVPKKYDAYLSTGNMNSFFAVSGNIMKNISLKTELYIQEAGANRKDSVRRAAAMLTADAFVLLNVMNHHADNYGSEDALFADKISFQDYMKNENGVVFANYDDDKISAYDFKCGIISFGAYTENDVDYRAVDIEQNREWLEFDVIHNEKKEAHIRIRILGKQNVYSTLAAYAVAKWLNIDVNDIIESCEEYQSSGIRQNYRQIGKTQVLMDTYNCSEDSLIAVLEAVKKFDIGSNNKKIAVISGENRLGRDVYKETTYQLGRKLDLKGIDHVICMGAKSEEWQEIFTNGDGKTLYDGIKSTGFSNVEYVSSAESLEHRLRDMLKPGDFLLLKGQEKLNIAPVVDKILGSDFSLEHMYYTLNTKRIIRNGFIAKEVLALNSLNIVGSTKLKPKNVLIPNDLDGVKIHRISSGVFQSSKSIKTVNFGKSLINIGAHSFKDCTNLRKITIPSNVKIIGDYAFMNCTKLEVVELEEGLVHIGEGAFKNCISIKNINIPKTVEYIAENAFSGCGELEEKVRKQNKRQ